MTRDDARLTAYVLNELPDEERLEVERRLAADADARREVDELREVCGVLDEALGAEPMPELDPDRRTAVEAAISRAEQVGEGAVRASRLRHLRGWTLSLLPTIAVLSASLAFCVPGRLARPVSATAGLPLVSRAVGVLAWSVQRGWWVLVLGLAAVALLPALIGAPPPAVPSRLRRWRYALNAVLIPVGVGVIVLATVMPPARQSMSESGPGALRERLEQGSSVTDSAVAADGDALQSPNVLEEGLVEDVAQSRLPALGVGEAARGTATGSQLPARPAQPAAEPEIRAEAQPAAESPLALTRTYPEPAPPALVPVAGAPVRAALPREDRSQMAASAGRAARAPRAADLAQAVVSGRREAGTDQVRLIVGGPEGAESEEQFELAPGALSRDAFDAVADNPFRRVADHPLSTFSIDVDTASYSVVRRMLSAGRLPPPGAVRLEELVNYFDYEYPGPVDGTPFAPNVEVASCPWAPGHRLLRVGLQAREMVRGQRPPANLVFLIDVSGSMRSASKLGLVREGLRLLVSQLRDDDRVAMVVYAGSSGLVLDSTPGSERERILAAVDALEAGGSTNGGAGIELAYRVAADHFAPRGVNRVILATDGDFNVGTTSQSELLRLIAEKADTGVFLTVLGFGMGNLQDSTLEKLADRGNGNYAFIDTLAEARKVLVDQLAGTLVAVAKDVKIQIEFNPYEVAAYRLLGYENRVLAAEDFSDDSRDAGEIGAGHTVTAFYEIVPAGQEDVVAGQVGPLRYQAERQATAAATSGELLTLSIRYKEPDADTSRLQTYAVHDGDLTFGETPGDFRFAAGVAMFGMVLRDSPHRGDATLKQVAEIAGQALGEDRYGYRREFLELVEQARALRGE